MLKREAKTGEIQKEADARLREHGYVWSIQNQYIYVYSITK